MKKEIPIPKKYIKKNLDANEKPHIFIVGKPISQNFPDVKIEKINKVIEKNGDFMSYHVAVYVKNKDTTVLWKRIYENEIFEYDINI